MTKRREWLRGEDRCQGQGGRRCGGDVDKQPLLREIEKVTGSRDDKGKGNGSMESGFLMKTLGPATTLYGTVAPSFVIPSEAEGSAVPRTLRGNVFSARNVV